MRQDLRYLRLNDALQRDENKATRNVPDMVSFYEDQISQLTGEVIALMDEIEELKEKYGKEKN